MRTNLDPKVWGKHGWFFLESVIIGYPEKPTEHDKSRFKKWFTLIQYVLPCEKCRYNYRRHLQEHPLNDKILSCKRKLMEWMIQIHNLASGTNYSYNDTMNYYMRHYSGKNGQIREHFNNKKEEQSIHMLSTLILVLIAIVIIYKKCSHLIRR